MSDEPTAYDRAVEALAEVERIGASPQTALAYSQAMSLLAILDELRWLNGRPKRRRFFQRKDKT